MTWARLLLLSTCFSPENSSNDESINSEIYQNILSELLTQHLIESVWSVGIQKGPYKLASGLYSKELDSRASVAFKSQLCLSLGSCVTLGKSLSLSEPRFLPVKNETTTHPVFHWAIWDSIPARQRKAEGVLVSLLYWYVLRSSTYVWTQDQPLPLK